MGAANIVTTVIGRRIALPSRVLEQYPELEAVKWRQGGLPVNVAGWFLGQRSVAAITLWRTVFLSPSVLVDALDFILTRGVMPAAMKQTIVTAVTNDSSSPCSPSARRSRGATTTSSSDPICPCCDWCCS